jgi:hypothetical protein
MGSGAAAGLAVLAPELSSSGLHMGQSREDIGLDKLMSNNSMPSIRLVVIIIVAKYLSVVLNS